MSITIEACANIALQKYWGKRNERLFLPTKSSLAFTVAQLKTVTHIAFSDKQYDEIILDWGHDDTKATTSIVHFLNQFRERYQQKSFFIVKTQNDFPTASGLASSSSGFAALALGLNELCKLYLSARELSLLARCGSGSAARSIYGGFSLWHKGEQVDGSDSYAEQLFSHQHWPELRLLIVVLTTGQKTVGSRDGMRITQATSPWYQQWIVESEERLPALIASIQHKDFMAMGGLVEAEWEGMYHTMITSKPILNYWQTSSFEVMQCVKMLRKKGVACFFTTDAGPHVKILCLRDEVKKIKPLLEEINGVIKVIVGTNASDPVLY